jgi:hypothetical protein
LGKNNHSTKSPLDNNDETQVPSWVDSNLEDQIVSYVSNDNSQKPSENAQVESYVVENLEKQMESIINEETDQVEEHKLVKIVSRCCQNFTRTTCKKKEPFS